MVVDHAVDALALWGVAIHFAGSDVGEVEVIEKTGEFLGTSSGLGGEVFAVERKA